MRLIFSFFPFTFLLLLLWSPLLTNYGVDFTADQISQSELIVRARYTADAEKQESNAASNNAEDLISFNFLNGVLVVHFFGVEVNVVKSIRIVSDEIFKCATNLASNVIAINIRRFRAWKHSCIEFYCTFHDGHIKGC